MNKKYIAPQVEVVNIETQSIICASGGAASGGQFNMYDQNTENQW